YVGSGKSDDDAAALRANRPMPIQSGIFYFEVEVISKGRDGYIGIGFCSAGVSLKRLPGWEPDSWGYHGDDGHKFCCSGTGHRYGPTFSTGDIIGCCVNFANGTCFFTKNGMHLGVAFTDLNGRFFPSVGLRTPQEKVYTNFGDRPFCFDIKQYVRVQGGELKDTMAAERAEDALPNTLKELVLTHLVHHGYRASAQAFARDAMGLPWGSVLQAIATPADQQTVTNIYDAVMSGEIARANKLTGQHFPAVLRTNDEILFQLRCQEFIELMRRCTPSHTTDASMDMDEDDVLVGGVQSKGHDADTAKHTGANGVAGDDDNAESAGMDGQRLDTAIHEAMVYGQELQKDYQNDLRPHVSDTLVDVFSLFAYPDPSTSVVAHLLDPARREPVATALNSAIVASLGRPPTSTLERTYRQTAVVMETLAKQGVAGAGLL
ncbi:concanavalin A-like lectin/glucanase domain-containing protein, partial [Thamnocephalis sphaerospora]